MVGFQKFSVHSLSWLLLLSAGLKCSAARADGFVRPAVRLVYERAPAVHGCPDEQEVRTAVAGRLGYWPFTQDAQRVLVTRIGRERSLFAEIELHRADGKLLGARRLSAERGDCAELVRAAELAMSISIDPLAMSQAGPSVASSVSSLPTPATPMVPSPPPRSDLRLKKDLSPQPMAPTDLRSGPFREAGAETASKKPPLPHIQMGVGLLVVLGAEPATTVGLTAQLGLRWPLVSFALEGRADLPATAAGEGPRPQASLLAAALVPCLHYRYALACPLATLGALRGTAVDAAATRRETTFYAAAGLRLGAEFRLWRFLVLRAFADLYGVITPTTLFIAERPVWQSPPVNGTLGIALSGNFL